MGVYSTLRDAIETKLNAVTNIGVVHDRYRYANQPEDFKNLFVKYLSGQRQVRGWVITLTAIPDAEAAETAFGEIGETWRFTCHGWLGFSDKDTTEHTFLDLVETVKNTLRSETNFGVTGAVEYSTRVTVPVIDIRTFAGILCHYCEIVVDLTVSVAVAST